MLFTAIIFILSEILLFWGERWNIFLSLNVVNLDLGKLLNCVRKNPKEPSKDG